MTGTINGMRGLYTIEVLVASVCLEEQDEYIPGIAVNGTSIQVPTSVLEQVANQSLGIFMIHGTL